MKDLFYQGGPLFMGVLSILFIVMIAFFAYSIFKYDNGVNKEQALRNISNVKSIGLFALVFGILGQLIGLYTGLSVIEQAGNISPSLLSQGIKISMISTMYGLLIFAVSIVLSLVSNIMIERR